MMRLFDYIYYRVSSYYIYSWNEDVLGPMYGTGIMGVLITAHFAFILILLSFISEDVHNFFFDVYEGQNMYNDFRSIVMGLITAGLVFYRYLVVRPYSQIESNETWKSEPIAQKKKKGYLIALYIIISILFTAIAAIYRAAHFSL